MANEIPDINERYMRAMYALGKASNLIDALIAVLKNDVYDHEVENFKALKREISHQISLLLARGAIEEKTDE